jgi:hypothetical protein
MPQIGMGNCRSNILDVRRDQQVLPGGIAANARGLATAMAEGNKKGARTGRPPFNRVLNRECERIKKQTAFLTVEDSLQLAAGFFNNCA